ncbi:MAG: FHA domain-containing protein [Planctomycetota bacterium]|nr:FHA domain-containing protein [Planctomycetota bacterium]MEE3285426.1 FHA domain-containing protein [Planctomycetota bacterium]MEE3366853.1 FHA domain-containing protein [Planctomycetota bacterium]
MAKITIQVLEGLERGRVFDSLETPVTIGREDDNSIQLNDERISRFHSKIQEDGQRIILTDLDSTNGTRVNGRPVQLRVLKPGDQVAIGRCLLVFGSNEEIAEHLKIDPILAQQDTNSAIAASPDITLDLQPQADADADLDLIDLFPGGPPELPTQLTALQQAQLSDLVSFVHDRIASILRAAESAEPMPINEQAGGSSTPAEPGIQELIDDPDKTLHDENLSTAVAAMVVPVETWQRLLALEMQLAVYIRSISEPNEAPGSPN